MGQPRARALVEPDAREWHDHTESVGEHVAHRPNHRRVLPVDLPRHTRGGWFRCRLSSAEIFFPGCIQPGLDSRLKKFPVKTVKVQVKQQRLSWQQHGIAERPGDGALCTSILLAQAPE